MPNIISLLNFLNNSLQNGGDVLGQHEQILTFSAAQYDRSEQRNNFRKKYEDRPSIDSTTTTDLISHILYLVLNQLYCL